MSGTGVELFDLVNSQEQGAQPELNKLHYPPKPRKNLINK